MAKKSTSANIDQNKIVNLNRSLRVFGEINAEMVSELTPPILGLQQASSDPITLLIDSLGGSIQAADVLAGLLKSPTQAGMKTWVNAIVTGHAASAAAHLLATAEYAISYQHSRLSFPDCRERLRLDARSRPIKQVCLTRSGASCVLAI